MIILGTVVFGAVRPLFVAISGLFGIQAASSSHVLLGQVLLGLVTGIVTMPISTYLFKRKWARIVACSAVGSMYGAMLLIFAATTHQMDIRMLTSAVFLVAMAWSFCGFFAGWLTVALSQVLEDRLAGSPVVHR
jgi:hypothetical protein